MSQTKKRSACQQQPGESSKRFKRALEQEGAGVAAEQTLQEPMSLQCAEVRTSSSWLDGQPIPLCVHVEKYDGIMVMSSFEPRASRVWSQCPNHNAHDIHTHRVVGWLSTLSSRLPCSMSHFLSDGARPSLLTVLPARVAANTVYCNLCNI